MLPVRLAQLLPYLNYGIVVLLARVFWYPGYHRTMWNTRRPVVICDVAGRDEKGGAIHPRAYQVRKIVAHPKDTVRNFEIDFLANLRDERTGSLCCGELTTDASAEVVKKQEARQIMLNALKAWDYLWNRCKYTCALMSLLIHTACWAAPSSSTSPRYVINSSDSWYSP